jgi:RNA polymerase sigma-70 factor (ECF subfamily)
VEYTNTNIPARAVRQRLETDALDRWFSNDVLPLEPALMRFLRRHWRHVDDLPDLRQEVYLRVYDSAQIAGIPDSTRAFVFMCARNLLVDQARRAQVVSIETIGDLEELSQLPGDDFSPERLIGARQELRMLQAALDELPPRCREIVAMRKIEELSHEEISERLGIAQGTIEKQITLGVRAIAKTLYERGVEAAELWMRRTRRGERDQ